MLLKMVITTALILTLLLGWLVIQHLARIFAKRHPELGPAREEGQGCGSSCGCQNKGSCKKN
ncbi:MAG: hypothetical protein OEL79_03140 [Chromatiales bacterium]|nr:hypothetical protein [Chromatiales bacterium]